MGPNINPFPRYGPLEEDLEATVILKVGDDITTDHIMPAGNKILPLRSNIEAMSEFVFMNVDPDFPRRCRETGNGIVVGGENYGQGSSREHAAIVPRFLGIRAKLAKSFARIHRANLINFGIIPMTFVRPEDYDFISEGDRIRVEGVRSSLAGGKKELTVRIRGRQVPVKIDVTDRERAVLLAGGLINTVSGA
jgi:aconitate hydratase